MRWYTAIGMKKDDADGRFCVWVDGEEKVLTEMETILWAALTWSFWKLYTALSDGQSWLPWPFHGQNA